MEYAKDSWMVIAYDLRDKPLIMQCDLKEWVAKRIFHTWSERYDVGRVVCYDASVGRADMGV